MVEPRIVAPVVVGSIPIIHPISSSVIVLSFRYCLSFTARRHLCRMLWFDVRDACQVSLKSIFMASGLYFVPIGTIYRPSLLASRHGDS